ncbi:MAG: DNA polymerase III subunit beta [Moorellaceae bacterium]
MYVTCIQPQLLSAVQKVYRAIAPTSTMPALSGILLTAAEGKLTFHATDLEIGIIFSLEAEIHEEGELLLPARIFSDLIRHLPPLEIEIKGNPASLVSISYQQSRAELYSLDPNQFPSPPQPAETASFKISAEEFKNSVKKVGIAAGTEDLRSIYHGVLWEVDPETKSFTMVATDTHRLALYRGKIDPLQLATPVAPIIPHKALQELSRLLPAEDTEVVFSLGTNQAFAQVENLTFYTRLLSGQFPPYRQVLPTGFLTEVKLPTDELTLAVERATILARDDTKLRSSIIHLEIGKTFKLLSQTPEVGQLEEELAAEISGRSLEVALNGRYLLDALKVIEEEKVALKLNESLKPVVVQPQDADNYFCLILPVRIG